MTRRPKVALLWAQFSAYHVDRCEAVARVLGNSADLYAVEVATTSDTYDWAPSGEIVGCQKVTLFTGSNIDRTSRMRLFWKQTHVLRSMDVVFLGVGYARLEQFLVAALLRLIGVRVILMNDSKFDDFPRSLALELLKPIAMLPYNAAIVAGARHQDYLRFLGFGRRRVLQGYDTVSVERLRQYGLDCPLSSHGEHAKRPFVFVGRFVDKKNIPFLIAGFRRYVELAGLAARRLALVGAGPLEAMIQQEIKTHGIERQVTFLGFLNPTEVAQVLAGSLALILPSLEEQWGLVVNEAVAVGIPVIVSENVGARDHLVRNLVNGFVIEHGSVEGLARAMLALCSSRDEWERMAANAYAIADRGDSVRFAEAVVALMP